MNSNAFGFKEGDLEIIVGVISIFPEIEKAAIFGSRAKGNYKTGSDTDIAIWATSDKVIGELYGMLNDETLLPYKFDVLDYNKITNPQLKEQIDLNEIPIYLK